MITIRKGIGKHANAPRSCFLLFIPASCLLIGQPPAIRFRLSNRHARTRSPGLFTGACECRFNEPFTRPFSGYRAYKFSRRADRVTKIFYEASPESLKYQTISRVAGNEVELVVLLGWLNPRRVLSSTHRLMGTRAARSRFTGRGWGNFRATSSSDGEPEDRGRAARGAGWIGGR